MNYHCVELLRIEHLIAGDQSEVAHFIGEVANDTGAHRIIEEEIPRSAHHAVDQRRYVLFVGLERIELVACRLDPTSLSLVFIHRFDVLEDVAKVLTELPTVVAVDHVRMDLTITIQIIAIEL